MRLTVGRIVHYKLGVGDAAEINRRRNDASTFRRNDPALLTMGFVAHHGNQVFEGDVCPAVVVSVFDSSAGTANLQVLLDGNDQFWATSRTEGDGPGQWSWPPRA